ncbi:transmembrane 9 superfamily member 2 [Oncorhynchus kisutch]|uniref:transmembrane 9 superfamily member 2 n=1 Tax=Oncorhynchus kisutch TaxID=8019 RepID=UPI0009A00220|nr:transmembrane 9 superfamily member 2 [Oncorhynchus kisutch]
MPFAYFSFKKPVIEQPVRTKKITQQIHEHSFFTKPMPGIIMGGIHPSGCIFFQLFWVPVPGVHHFPHHLVQGHHPATSTCVKRTPWWLHSFLTSLFMAVYLFVYGVHYFFTKLQIIIVAITILYFTMIMVLKLFLFTRESTTEPHYGRLDSVKRFL